MDNSIRTHASEDKPTKKVYIPSSIRQKAAYKNGPRRLIFNMRPSKAYEEEKVLHGKTLLFPFTTGSR